MKQGQVSIDTLRLTVKYPKSDIFRYWNRYKEGSDTRALKRGIIAEDWIVSTGAAGYPLSLVEHDARIFLTNETDEIRGDKKGMGILVQLGPKFIIHHYPRLESAVDELLARLGINHK